MTKFKRCAIGVAPRFLPLLCGVATCLLMGAAPRFPLVELTCGEDTYQGKAVAHDDQKISLIQRDGWLRELEVPKVSEFRKISDRFESYSDVELRDRLRREFGNRFAIVGTGHYLVCARKEQAQGYAKIFEELYRTFHVYFGARGFKISEPEFPLVAIVFPDHDSFAQYSKGDGVPAPRGLLGYYLKTSNRIALFDNGKKLTTNADVGPVPFAAPLGRDSLSKEHWSRELALFSPSEQEAHDWPFGLVAESGRDWFGSIEAGLQDTIIHEATHQVAFNTGLHNRLGTNPKWVVEGLATVFEAAGIRGSEKHFGAITRVNPNRYTWFGNYRQTRRQPRSLESFVGSDESFRSALDAYAESWALTFFLVETRPSEYAKYLRTIASRPPLEPYEASDRVEDFKAAFGTDLDMLEAAFLRFIDGLKSAPGKSPVAASLKR